MKSKSLQLKYYLNRKRLFLALPGKTQCSGSRPRCSPEAAMHRGPFSSPLSSLQPKPKPRQRDTYSPATKPCGGPAGPICMTALHRQSQASPQYHLSWHLQVVPSLTFRQRSSDTSPRVL